MDYIELSEFRFDTHIGILPWERKQTQPLDVSLRLGLDLQQCAETGDLSFSLNYAAVCHQVLFLAQIGRWRLLETLGHAICRHLLLRPTAAEKRATLSEIEVRLAKPAVLQKQEFEAQSGQKTAWQAVPAVSLRHSRAWCQPFWSRPAQGVRTSVLADVPEATALRVEVKAGAYWEPPPDTILHMLYGSPQDFGSARGFLAVTRHEQIKEPPGHSLPR